MIYDIYIIIYMIYIYIYYIIRIYRSYNTTTPCCLTLHPAIPTWQCQAGHVRRWIAQQEVAMNTTAWTSKTTRTVHRLRCCHLTFELWNPIFNHVYIYILIGKCQCGKNEACLQGHGSKPRTGRLRSRNCFSPTVFQFLASHVEFLTTWEQCPMPKK